MVDSAPALDLVFGALADPTRRRILELLMAGELRVGEIAESFAISLAAVSKHLQVLERAGLLARRREGRVHHLRARPEAIASAHAWITRYAQGWSDGFDALERHLDQQHAEQRVSGAPEKRKKKGRSDGRRSRDRR